MLFKDAKITIEPVEVPDYVGQTIKNIQYGPEKWQLLDLYLPKAEKTVPLLLDLQGGGLVRGEKSSFKLGPSLRLVKDGYAVASMNYSLISSRSFLFPKQIAEMRAAIKLLNQLAGKHNLIADKIDLAGESSGAQLALLYAASVSAGVKLGHIQADDGLAGLPKVQHVIANYGPYEFDQFARQFAEEKIQPKYAESGQAISFEGLALAGLAVTENPIGVSQGNPANYFTKKMPAVIAYAGSDDQVVPYQQSQEMIKRYRQMTGNDAAFHLIEGGHHGIVDYDTAEIYQQKYDFLQH